MKPEIEYTYEDMPALTFGLAEDKSPADLRYCITNYFKYGNKKVTIGGKLLWHSAYTATDVEITVDQIRLNPTPRVYDEATGSYYLLRNCAKIKSPKPTEP